MDTQRILEQLKKLMQLDVDAVNAYQQALKKMETHPTIHHRINSFCKDHEKHISDLSTEITNLGATPPETTADFKGLLIEGFTALRSLTGIEGALKAMRGNEKLTNTTYAEALEELTQAQASSVVLELVQKNYEDEKRHLNYIEQVLKDEAWKNTAVSA